MFAPYFILFQIASIEKFTPYFFSKKILIIFSND